MALTFDQYVKNKNTAAKSSNKLTYDQYLKQVPAATPAVNMAELLPEPTQKTKSDNHDVLHSIAPATTANEIVEASVNKAKSDANTINLINDVIWGDVRNIPSRVSAWSNARQALKSGNVPMDYSGANINPATDLYVKQQNDRRQQEIIEQQNAIKAQIEEIDKQIQQSNATAAQYRARTGGLANSAARDDAQRMVDEANRKTEELQKQRQNLMNELHSVGGKYGVGDFIGDTGEMLFSNAGLQAPDIVDYYLSRGVGLIDKDDQEAYDRAHALQYDRAQQIADAQSGRSQFGQDYMQAAAAFGDMLSNTAVAYASGIPQALQTYGASPATALQNSGIHDLDPTVAGRVIAGADKLAGNILTDVISSPTNVAISLSSGVHTFDEAKTKGASSGQAFAAAVGSAAAEYFSNKMFSGTPLENNPAEKGYVVEAIERFSKWLGKEEQVEKFFSNKLASFVFDKTGEGWEEVITAVLEPWIAHFTYDKDADLATLKELWNEWYIGTFMSVLADAGEPLTKFRAQKAEAREQEKTQKQQAALAKYLAYLNGQGNVELYNAISADYELMKNAKPADIAKAYNVGRNSNKEALKKESDLETLAAGTMGIEGLKLAAQKRGAMADIDTAAYYNEARQAYDMGRSGKENTFKGNILSTKEANAWYNAGINDAKEDTNEQRQSGNEGQGRVDGLDSQRQRGPVVEGPAGQQSGAAEESGRGSGQAVQTVQGESGSRKEAAVKLGQASPRTSATDHGIANGTDAKTMHVISEDTMDQWHPDMVEVFNKGKQNGIKVNFYTGRMALDDGHGVFFVRGLNVGDGSVVWIRADADEDIRNIAGHEFFHTAEKRDPGLVNRIVESIDNNNDDAKLHALFQKYYDKYADANMSDEEILSEIFADAYGGIDIFAGITDAKDATAEQKARATDLSETVRSAVKESKPAGAKQNEALNLDSYSLEQFEDGTRYVNVNIDQDVFDGLTPKEMSQKAVRIIKSKFAGKVIGIDNKVFVNGKTAKEYAYPVKQLGQQEYEAKLHAATELDNLLDAGTNFRTEPDGQDGHSHPNMVDDFRYFDTIFKVGNEYYKGVINIMPIAKGLLLKDITQIENITKDVSSSYGQNPKSTFLRDVSMDRIADGSGKVNTEKDQASRESGLSKADQKTLEKNNATVADDVVISNDLAPVMESPEFHKPVSVSDLADLASHDTLPAWAESYLAHGGAQANVKAIQRFDDMIWRKMGGEFTDTQKLLQAIVPSGKVAYTRYGPLRENVEYRRSFDMDTSCPRTFQFVAYRDAIKQRLNRTLTFEESINLINLMAAYHQMIPCTYCYVENKRILKAAYYNSFYGYRHAVMEGVKNGLAIQDLRPLMYGYNAEKGTLTKAAENTLKEWMADKSDYNPTIEENYRAVNLIRNDAMHYLDGLMADGTITSDTSVESLTNMLKSRYKLSNKGAIAEAEGMAEDWKYDAGLNNDHVYLTEDDGEEPDFKHADKALTIDHDAVLYGNSASSAKTVENYVPYTDNIFNIDPETKAYIIGMGGIRKHSSNDFRIDYVLDYFQFFADLAADDWTGHTYTKNEDYVRIFGRTGDMINMSIAFDDTKDGVVENVSEGMEHKLAQELRKAYQNAGVMAMVTSDKQLSFALNADWVDMIIPFHHSGLPKSVWYNMKAWSDYTSVQSESFYNADEMREALTSIGIDTKGMKAAEVSDFFYKNFDIKRVSYVETQGKDKGKTKYFAPHFFPYETTQHGVKIPGHNNSRQTYLDLCKEYGVHPRFDGVEVEDADGNAINAIDHPNYMKLVKEAAAATENFVQPKIQFTFNKADPYLSEKYGAQIGKKSVTPFDYAMDRLTQEAKNGGYSHAGEDSMGIVDQFIEEYAGKSRPIGWLSEKAETVKEALDRIQDKAVDAYKKDAVAAFAVDDKAAKPKTRTKSNFFVESKAARTMASREDADYMAAVESGDMKAAKRMVDEAAKAAGYTLSAYHGTGEFFNVFRRGAEGIHLGNEATAAQVAKDRYKGRSQQTFYHWSDIRNRVSEMDTETRRTLVASMFDHYDTDHFTGNIKDATSVRDYVDNVLAEYRRESNKPDYDMPITLPTFDRKIGENVMHLYAKLNNPFVVNSDIIEWSAQNIAALLQQRARGADEMSIPYAGKHIKISGSEVKFSEEDMQRLQEIADAKIKKDDAWIELSGILERAGYDGIKYLNQYEGDKKSYSYIALNPSDVKLADPVTYDGNGNVIPLSERFNPENNDIRYSRDDDTNRLMQENIDLRQRLDVALADTKQTRAWRANTKDVTRVAEDIIAATSSKESKPIVEQKIRSLVEAASNGGIDSAEMKDMALDIARGLLKRSSVLTSKDSTTYDGMRDYLRKIYINVPTEMRKEFTDWKAFAAAHKAMRMKTDGVAISAAYKEMQKRMGKDYFPDMGSDIDKLRQVAEILDTLTPVYDNPYSVNMAEATEETANSILESILNIGQAEATFADRAKARENEVRELYQQKLADQKAYLQQRIQDEADKRKQQTEEIKQHYIEMQENRRLRKQDSEARQKLLRVAKRLQNRKLDAVNRAMVDQLIGDLDTVSVNLTNRSLTNLRELADWYDSYKDDPNFLSDPQIEKKLARLQKRHIGEMTLDEVRDLTDVLRSIENALATYGKMVRIEDHRLISEMSEQSQENIRNTRGSKKNIADWLVTNTLAPERLVRRLTGYNDTDPLYMRTKELSEGQRKMFDYQMRAEALFSKWTNDKKLIERLRDKDTIKVRAFVDGKETSVEITPDMRMALYLHSLNDQNLKHIMNGGVRIPDIEMYRKGDVKEAYSRGVTAKMSPDMVRGIANGMSVEERAFANAAKAYFNGMSRDEINAVSEALLGYSLANVDNYFPIQTDDAFTMKEIDAIQNDGSIQGMGFTKERQNASNAIYLVPMTDVLKRSIQNHAKYVGMAIPVANMNRLWMANTKDGETDFTSGLKDTMRSKWGDRANEAVEKILTDVQNPVRKTDDISKALAKVRSNYAGAVLTLNASVAMKQAASYPTAAAVLGWEPVLKALKDFQKVDTDLIAKYTPLYWYRGQGFSTQELGDIKSQSGLMDKVLNAHITNKDGKEVPLLNWIQGIDLATTKKLWNASEYYVQQNQKNLRVGTDDYYKAVADIYNRVIEETQPNYTTMQRPQLLRSDNQLLQSLVMFKTQPFQNFNILYDAIGELRAAETMAKNGDDSKLKQAKQNAVNAVTSNLVSAVVFAAMTMAWSLARRKRDKYEDDEGNFIPWGQLGKDILSSELGMIPFGSDVYNLIASALLGEKYYGMTNITSDSLSGAAESTLNAFNTLKDTVTALIDGDDKTQADPEKIARKLFATAKDASKMLGIPMENVLNLMTAVYSNVAAAVNGEYVTAYELLRLEKGFSSSANKSTAYDILYKAYNNDRSEYNEIRSMMLDDGFKESSIDSAMKKRSAK